MNKEQGSSRRPRLIVVIFLLCGALLVLSVVSFLVWAVWIPQPDSVALAALESDESVTVSTHGWLEFSPRAAVSLGAANVHIDETSMTLPESANEDTGSPTGTPGSSAQPPQAQPSSDSEALILYPGARIDYRAYAPLAHEIARRGHLVIVFPMPLNIAFFKPDAALEVMHAYPAVQHWVIGGHSLGGIAAAQFVHDYLSDKKAAAARPVVTGLILLAARTPVDISALSALRVLTISGDKDGLITPQMVEENKHLQPATAQFKNIAGANHANFVPGNTISGDNPATISPESQRKAAVNLIAEFLR